MASMDPRLSHIKTQEITDEWWERCEGAYCEWGRLHGITEETITQTKGCMLFITSNPHNAQVMFAFCTKQHGRLWIEWFYNSPILITALYMGDYIHKVTPPSTRLRQ